MKTALLAFAFLVTGSMFTARAQAMIPVPGAFIAHECGDQAVAPDASGSATSVQQICIGQIAGADGEAGIPAVAFRLGNSGEKVFRIQSTASLLMAFDSGVTKSLFYLVADDGTRTTMQVEQSRANRVLTVAGSLSVLGGEVHYYVSHFQPVFVVQDF